ncbi:complement C1q tumor necrosis factor-related protein 3-like [Saccostrea echinata]|uniref:complement C1q tumor necrosis factor-related protein 3-like n=1 Tax=Saccostrea echinata TaxID=191078 RepID=UPI002A823396|nr:complement C1q tumor necrosis factor-related protein 3-like [Saccostrea echinata]
MTKPVFGVLTGITFCVLQLVAFSYADLPAIGFSAKLSRNIQLGKGEAVKYDTVITNKGNAYNRWSGHFTAPLKGLYLFSCTILAQHRYHAHIEIMKNGSKISTLYSSTTDQSSQTIVLVLREGDTVWTRQAWTGRHLHDHVGYNMFTGVLISENV